MAQGGSVVTVNADEVFKAFARVAGARATAKMRQLLRKEMRVAKKEVAIAGTSQLGRSASGGVNSRIWKRALGGNINILGNGGKVRWRERRHTLKAGQWGGNRVPVSARTQQIRQIGDTVKLRFLNSGTAERHTRLGARGKISARDWFAPVGARAMEALAARLAPGAEAEILKLWNSKI